MDSIRAASPVTTRDEQPARPWLRGILSAGVFGTLGAAAMSWLGHVRLTPAERAKPGFGRTWSAVLGGAATGSIAFYSTVREAGDTTQFGREAGDKPGSTISTDSIEQEKVLSPGERSL